MTKLTTSNRSTQVSQFINAPREVVYAAFIEADAVETWLPPGTMRGQIHAFEPRPGGKFRMSLTYTDPQDALPGKSSDDTDTSEGTFVELVPNEKIVQVTAFESDDPAFAGEMTITWSMADADGGTEVTVLCEGIPQGVRLEDNELGSRESLQKLAAFIEAAVLPSSLPNIIIRLKTSLSGLKGSANGNMISALLFT